MLIRSVITPSPSPQLYSRSHINFEVFYLLKHHHINSFIFCFLHLTFLLLPSSPFSSFSLVSKFNAPASARFVKFVLSTMYHGSGCILAKDCTVFLHLECIRALKFALARVIRPLFKWSTQKLVNFLSILGKRNLSLYSF